MKYHGLRFLAVHGIAIAEQISYEIVKLLVSSTNMSLFIPNSFVYFVLLTLKIVTFAIYIYTYTGGTYIYIYMYIAVISLLYSDQITTYIITGLNRNYTRILRKCLDIHWNVILINKELYRDVDTNKV